MKNKMFIPVVTMVFFKKNKFLLTRRRDSNKEFDRKWQFPGGGWEVNESLEEALKRETKEELGIELKEYKFLPKIFEEVREKYHLLFFVFYAPFPKGAKIILNEEADKYGWFSLKEIKKIPFLPLIDKILQELENTLKNSKVKR